MKADKMSTSNFNGIPAMSPPEVHAYLRELGAGWTGQGSAVEVGCWLGATSAALMEGLVEAGYDKPFWAFDRWMANEAEVIKAAQQGVQIHEGQDLKPVYLKNVLPYYRDVKPVQGKAPQQLFQYKGGPIEFCMFDAPKRNPVFRRSVGAVLPYFIPGVTVFGLMDYYFYRSRRDGQQKPDWAEFLAPVKFIDTYKENFTLLREFPDNGSCVFFRYEKLISWKQ